MADGQVLSGWPLTEAQEGLWFAQRLDPGSPALNTGHYLELRGPLDLAAFRDAVDATVAEADALALRFRETGGTVLQHLDPGARPWLEVVDLTAAFDPEADARAAMAADMETPLDLAADRVAAQRLYRIAPDRHLYYHRAHHLVLDGFGWDLVLRRVAALYAERLTGEDAGPALSPFAAVVAEDVAYRATPKRGADAAYWRGLMAGAPDVPRFGTGLPIAGRSSHKAHATLPAGTGAALHRMAAAHDIAWPDLLTTLLALYWRRVSGDGETGTEAVVGVTFMNRFGRAGARVASTLMNVLPLRVRGDEAAAWPEPLDDMLGQLARLRRHGRYRGEQLRRDLGRSGLARPLHGAIVNIQPFHEVPAFPGLTARLHLLGTGPVDDFTFDLRTDPAATVLHLDVEANPGLYSAEETAGHATRAACFVLAALDAEGPAAVATATPAEARFFVTAVNDTAHPVPDTTLTALIEAAMRAHPDAAAAVLEGETLDYAGLDRRSGALAAVLAARGIGPGDIVAVALERSLDLVVGLVGILRAGAAYLPLDPAHPADRLARILASARPRLVLAAVAVPGGVETLVPGVWGVQGTSPHARGGAGVEAHPSEFPLAGDPRVRPGDDVGGEEGGGGGEPRTPAPGDAAYVIYTSGSTGDPKGVVVEHRAIVNRLLWMKEQHNFTPRDRVLQKTQATFDVSVWEFFLPLLTGATLVLAPPGTQGDPAAIARLIRGQGITAVHFVPSMLGAFLAHPDAAGLAVPRVFCSGEALTAELRDRFHATMRGELHNLYGPTEAAVDVTFWDASRGDRSTPMPIGRPVWNTRMYVLDEALRPLPHGVTGHLFIAGAQLAREYLGRPDLTARAFIPDPFHPGERMYRTGDLARFRPDGAILYAGRSDGQVKLRGFRIETGEIEAALATSPLVRHARVIARQDRRGDRHLVAYLVPGPGYDAAILRAHVAARVPDYMVPAAFVPLDALPVNSSGKLDRAALPEPEIAAGGGRAPATDTERRLAAVFAEVLDLREVGAEDDFFALGGHSLLAVELMLGVQAEFGRDPGLGAVFEHPTVARLARLLDAAGLPPPDDGLRPLITLGRGRAGAPPLFAVHPAGGIAWCYGGLARALAPECGVLGLQAPAIDPAVSPPDSLDALAADYAARIVAACPDGPVHLAGWSVGGIIAQAIAVRLRDAGRAVGAVALLDAYPADAWRAQPEPEPGAMLRALLVIAGHAPADFAGLPMERGAVMGFLRRGGTPLGRLPQAALDGVVRVVADNNRLVRGHRHRRFDGRVVHFRAAHDHAGRGLSPEMWRPYAGTVEAIDVPALHGEMIGSVALPIIAPVLRRLMGP